MTSKFFLDTNVFVYSFDPHNPAKQKAAQRLIDRALESSLGVISFQVIQEFLNVALSKFKKPFSTEEGKGYLEQVFRPLCEVFPSIDLYKAALDIKRETGFSFFDCLIVGSALQSGCKVLYSENLQPGRRVSGVRIENPF